VTRMSRRPPSRPSALACPDSLKGVLDSGAAAAAIARGFRSVGVMCDELPLADGGEGTRAVLAEFDDGRRRVVEAAEAIPFDPRRIDVTTSSRPLGDLIARLDAEELIVCLGGTANMDAGQGLLEVLDALPAPTTVLCDVQTTLYDAPREFGPQKGATPGQVQELEARFRAVDELAPYADLPGSGAAGGLGAAFAYLGAKLVAGSAFVLDHVAFRPERYDVVVTGEGRVDGTTRAGKVAAEVARRCAEAGTSCVVFGGVVSEPLPDVETVALSGDRGRAGEDLVDLGRRLGTRLLDAAS